MHVFMGIPASVCTVYVDSEARGEETEKTLRLSPCRYQFKISLLMRTERKEFFLRWAVFRLSCQGQVGPSVVVTFATVMD